MDWNIWRGFDSQCMFLYWGETTALFAIGLIFNNEFQGTARSLDAFFEEIAKQPWSRAAGQGHMLKHMSKCNKYDNCILGQKRKKWRAVCHVIIYPSMVETWRTLIACRRWVAWWLVNCMELGEEKELVYLQQSARQNSIRDLRKEVLVMFPTWSFNDSLWFEAWKRERRGIAYMLAIELWIHCLHKKILFWF